MKVRDCMSRDVRVTTPEKTLREAAQAMSDWDTGALPVADNDRLVGMITDRDIAIRGIGEGRGPDAKVWEAMTTEVEYCREDDEATEALDLMGRLQVRRLPVLNKDHNLVGIVSLSDLSDEEKETGETLGEIARPGGAHTQTAH